MIKLLIVLLVSDLVYYAVCMECKQSCGAKLLSVQASAELYKSNPSKNSSMLKVSGH